MSENHDHDRGLSEVICVSTAKEAAEICEMLHRAGIAAAPDARSAPCRVLVPIDSVPVAEAIVDAVFFRPQGDVDVAEIEWELEQHRDSRASSGEPVDDEPQRSHSLRWLLLLGLFALITYLVSDRR